LFTYRYPGYRNRVLTRIAAKVAVDTAVAGVASVVPPIGVAYAAYKAINFGYKLYKHLERDENQKALSETVTTFSSAAVEKISEPDAIRLSKFVSGVAMASGLVNEISSKMGVDGNLYQFMLEGTTKGAITGGAGNLTEYVVGTAMAI